MSKTVKYGLDKDGIEHPDPRPIEIPTRLRTPGRQVDRIRNMIRQEMSQAAAASGRESFEDADDFNMEEVEFTSPYENEFEPEIPVDKSAQQEENDGRSNSAAPLKESEDGSSSGEGEVRSDRVGDGNASRRRGDASTGGTSRDRRGKKPEGAGDPARGDAPARGAAPAPRVVKKGA